MHYLRYALLMVFAFAPHCVAVAQEPTQESTQNSNQGTATPVETTQDSVAKDPAKAIKEAAEIQAAAIQAAAVQAGPKALSRAFRLAAKRATPSVVVVYVYGQGNEKQDDNKNENKSADDLPLLKRAEPNKPPAQRLSGLGSGAIVGSDGLIITNNHVIRGASRVEVQLPDDSRIEATKMIGDPESDIAVLRVKSESPLPSIDLGDSDALEIGDWVLAIGSPFRLEATVSAGIISAKNRKLERVKRSRLLQTDAAINPGNSGGPLIDLDGKVIGISTAIATRSGFYQGVGFAVPINQAKWIANELDQHGRVRRAAMGTTLVELKPKIARKFDLPPGLGILVYQVIKDSVADQAGMKQLDVITEFAGQRVSDLSSLQEEIERTPIGSVQKVKVQRGGKEIILNVELAAVEDPTGGRAPKDDSGDDSQNADERSETGKQSEAPAEPKTDDKSDENATK